MFLPFFRLENHKIGYKCDNIARPSVSPVVVHIAFWDRSENKHGR